MPLSFTAVQAPNPKNKMSYHRNHKNGNAENASHIHVQRDAVRTVSLSATPRSRPTNGFYNKVNVNKEPKLNLCPGEALCLPGLLMSVVCIPMEFPNGPTNLHCYLLLPSPFPRPSPLSQKTSESISSTCSSENDLKDVVQMT